MGDQLGAEVVLEKIFPILAVADLEEALAYYTGTLGFSERWRWGTPTVRAGVVRDVVELQLVQSGTPGAPAGPAVIYCQVRGVVAYHAACITRGATISGALTEHAFGLRDFRVRDPDGNVLGFGEPLGAPPASADA